MDTDTNWQLIFTIIGTVAVVGSFVKWGLKGIRSAMRRPKLVLSEGPNVNNWHFLNTGERRRFVTFEVTNKKGQTAHRCIAKAIIIKHPQNVSLFKRECHLHWAGVPYDTQETGAQYIDIGATETRRLDIAFTMPSKSGESWLAIPLALMLPSRIPQATLPQGEYIVEVKVSCANGRGDSKTIRLFSPDNWQDLQAEKF